MLLFLVVGLACLFPMAVYGWLLSQINRRHHPVMVPGTWDFAGVLFAGSGFLLFAGPVLLNRLHHQWREYWLFSGSALSLQLSWYLWMFLWALYFLGVVGLSLYTLWRRRRLTSIYNIQAGVLQEILPEALARTRLPWNGADQHFVVGSPETGSHVLEIDYFPLMQHASLCWPEDGGLARTAVETELAKVLAGVPSRDNPVSVWLLSIAIGLFTIMLFVVVFLLASLFLPRPR